MIVCAEPLNASGKQSELHAHLNCEAEIVKRQRLERCHKPGEILFAANSAAHKNASHSRVGDLSRPVQNQLPIFRDVCPIVVRKLAHDLFDQISNVCILAVQKLLQHEGIEGPGLFYNGRITGIRTGRANLLIARYRKLLDWFADGSPLAHTLRVSALDSLT